MAKEAGAEAASSPRKVSLGVQSWEYFAKVAAASTQTIPQLLLLKIERYNAALAHGSQ